MTMAELAERYPHIEYADLDSLEDYYSSDVDDESADHHLRKEPEPVAPTEPRTTANMEDPAQNRHKQPMYHAIPASQPVALNKFSIDALSAESDKEEPEVLFMAASLFQFHVSANRKEDGFLYLTYVPGEVCGPQIFASNCLYTLMN